MGRFRPLHRPTAVVVEDDDEQRFLSAALLEEAEYDVVECETAEQALDVARELREFVQLVFSNVQLPGAIDGIEFAKRIHEELPDVLVIVTSGAWQERANELPQGVEFLSKPWRPLDLLIRAERARL